MGVVVAAASATGGHVAVAVVGSRSLRLLAEAVCPSVPGVSDSVEVPRLPSVGADSSCGFGCVRPCVLCALVVRSGLVLGWAEHSP